jgi:molybdenum cofactor cytidylyltransferase
MSQSSPTQPCILVLAAGRGERYRASGGSTHKLDALLGGPGSPAVLESTLASVRASGLPWHLERGPHPGMGDSIAAAVSATADYPGWLILPADLPLVQPDTLCTIAQALLDASAAHPEAMTVIQPRFQGQKGHPVAFSAAAGSALMRLAGDQGAASVVRRAIATGAWTALPTLDEGCVLDVDTVEAMAQVRSIWAQRQGRNTK